MVIVVGLAAVSGSSAQVAASPTTNVLPNVDITRLKGDDAEGTIAINPINPDEVFVTVNRFTARRSVNGGKTWSKAGGGVTTTCCDNASSWDEFGNLFLVNLNLLSDFPFVDQAPLYVSTNGGQKFKKLTVLNGDPDVDQPTVKAGAGAVWATWDEVGTIMASGAPVTGLGAIGPFTRPEPVNGSGGPSAHPPRRLPGMSQPAPGSEGGNGQFGDIAIGPAGQVVVAWQTSQPDGVSCPCEIDVNNDTDGLGPNGFGSAVKVTDTNVAKFDSIAPQPNRTIDAEGNLQYDRSGGPYDGRLYLVYTDAAGPPGDPGNDNTDIYVRHSDDDGATWSSALRVNDDATSRAQFLPYVAVDPVTGNLIVTWYDARNDPTNHDAIQYWGGASDDGGATFTNFQISSGSSNGDAGLEPDFEFGDYSWVDFFDGVAMPVWSDNSDSTADNPDGAGAGLDLYTSRIEVGPFCNGLRATIVGTPAGETIDGTSGNDVIAGLGGNDTIDGKGGNDTVCGDDGDDTLVQGAAPDGADILIGGSGVDATDYSGRAGNVIVTLDGEANDGEKKEGDNVQTENVVGGSGADKLTGDNGPNVLTGGAGKDKLFGKGGADTLNGSDGVVKNDKLDCGKNDGVADVFSADAQDKISNCP